MLFYICCFCEWGKDKGHFTETLKGCWVVSLLHTPTQTHTHMERQIHTYLTIPDNQQPQTVEQGQAQCKVNVLHHASLYYTVGALSWRCFLSRELKHFLLTSSLLLPTVTYLHSPVLTSIHSSFNSSSSQWDQKQTQTGGSVGPHSRELFLYIATAMQQH